LVHLFARYSTFFSNLFDFSNPKDTEGDKNKVGISEDVVFHKVFYISFS